MGKGFGQLHRLRGIVVFKLSHFEQKAFAGIISHGFPNTLRRILDQIPYVVPRKFFFITKYTYILRVSVMKNLFHILL